MFYVISKFLFDYVSFLSHLLLYIFFLSFRFVQLSWGRGECGLKGRGHYIELEIYCSLKNSRYAKRALALGRWFSNHIHRIFQL